MAIMEIRIKKWKYIYTIFRSNQSCIISSNNVTVLLKSVHAISPVFRQGDIFKNNKFFTWEWISRSRLKISLLELNRPKADMALSCSNNCLITRSNQKHSTPHNVLGNPRPFFMESNLKLSKKPRLHWTIANASAELFQQLLYHIEIRAY